MKRWRALGRERKIFYVLALGLPLAAFLNFIACFGGWTLKGGDWVIIAMSLPGFLLGAANLLLVWADRQPREIEAWHALMAAMLLPALFLLGLTLLFLWDDAGFLFRSRTIPETGRRNAEMAVIFLFVVVFVYLLQFLCEAVIAAPIPLLILWLTKKKRAAKAAFVLCLLLALTASVLVARRPFFRCPEKYRAYITEEEEERIVGFNSGVWSPRIPVFPVCVTVLNMDEDRVHVKTKYLFFGSSEMEITGLGTPDLTASLIHGLIQ